ncbi:hypothetical protein [Phyllobacterium lublinensis]|nr:hypothetical protein [Phyllobacterium sp. 2063]MBZ9653500.1 hypothetical protein [Phyllobacterium sp. 2063]
MIHQCVMIAAFLILFGLLGAVAYFGQDDPFANLAPMPAVEAPPGS